MDKVFNIPLDNPRVIRAVEALIDDGYDVEIVSLEQLVKDNNLDDPHELDYHRGIWTDEHKDWKFDDTKVKD